MKKKMVKMQDDFDTMKPNLEKIAKGITSHFGVNCEVAVHKFTGGYEHTIAIIENGHVTGRKVGDGASEIVLKTLKSGEQHLEDHYNYTTRTKNGRILKSTSIFIRNAADEMIGLFGINYDVTDFTVASNIITDFLKTEDGKGEEVDVITNDVNELLDVLIEESWRFIGKPVSAMSKDEKIRAIQYLDKRGAFLIKKSGDRVSKYYDISKYTLYKYLDEEEKEK